MSPHAVSVVILQVLDLIHHIDVVEALISEGVTSLDDWTWVKQLRYYRTGRPGSTALVVKMADATMEYSWEYQGNAPKLVYTPLTDRCYLTLTQVTASFLLACWSVSASAVLQESPSHATVCELSIRCLMSACSQNEDAVTAKLRSHVVHNCSALGADCMCITFP